MEALSHSASLADLIEKRSAARWTGCSARDFAEAVVAKLEWRCKQQSSVADVLGTQAKVKLLHDRAAAVNAQCLRGMEVQACEEYAKLADELGLTPDEVRSAGKRGCADGGLLASGGPAADHVWCQDIRRGGG